jgi:transcriptional regulator with XRE-family HTH domain
VFAALGTGTPLNTYQKDATPAPMVGRSLVSAVAAIQRSFRPDEHPLRRLMEAFELSKTELGSLFGVRRQAVDQWLERGVPSERQEKVQTLLAIADLLERKLKPGRLAGVARRPADAYGGKTMLELIAADRHRELLELVRESFDWASAA